MAYVIIKTKDDSVLIWQNNDANWDFFMAGMSDDVHWKNVRKEPIFPKKFHSFDQAKWYLDMRDKKLKARIKAKDKEWTFHIIREEELDVYLGKNEGADKGVSV